MISIFCKSNHKLQNICDDCRELRDYALERLEKCPFGEDKPTCAKCAVHCYKPVMREKIRKVMRYAGPRMIYKHPIMAIRHLFDGKRKVWDLSWLRTGGQYTEIIFPDSSYPTEKLVSEFYPLFDFIITISCLWILSMHIIILDSPR